MLSQFIIKATHNTHIAGAQLKGINIFRSSNSPFEDQPNKMFDTDNHFKCLDFHPSNPIVHTIVILIQEVIRHGANSITLGFGRPHPMIKSIRVNLALSRNETI